MSRVLHEVEDIATDLRGAVEAYEGYISALITGWTAQAQAYAAIVESDLYKLYCKLGGFGPRQDIVAKDVRAMHESDDMNRVQYLFACKLLQGLYEGRRHVDSEAVFKDLGKDVLQMQAAMAGFGLAMPRQTIIEEYFKINTTASS